MSLELVNALANLGTFFVISATAAIVQLPRARSSHHIADLNELRETMNAIEDVYEGCAGFIGHQVRRQ